MINLLKKVVKKVKEIITYSFKFNYDFPFSGIYIRISKGKHRKTVILKDTVGRHLWPTNLSYAMDELNYTDKGFIHIRSYDKYGIMVFFSDSSNIPFYVNEKRGFKEVIIPVKEYKDEIYKMLQSIEFARQCYENFIMDDVEADLANNSLVLSSKKSSLSIKIYKMAGSLPDDDELTHKNYLLTKIDDLDWYVMRPLQSANMTAWKDSSIIVTDQQLIENIMPPVEFFSISPLTA